MHFQGCPTNGKQRQKKLSKSQKGNANAKIQKAKCKKLREREEAKGKMRGAGRGARGARQCEAQGVRREARGHRGHQKRLQKPGYRSHHKATAATKQGYRSQAIEANMRPQRPPNKATEARL